MYYNTVNSTGAQLAEARERSMSQDERVLHICREWSGKVLTARRVYWLWINKYNYGHILLTSIRRSISTLKDSGQIIETGKLHHKCPVEQFHTTEKTIKAI